VAHSKGEEVIWRTKETASSCTSISSSCTSIIFKIPIIDMSKLQNYPCCYKRRFFMKGVRCISEQRWKVSQRFLQCWSRGLKAFWVVVGGCGWLKNNHRCLRRSICYSFFLISTDCRNRRSLIFTDSVSRKFKNKIYASYGLHKL